MQVCLSLRPSGDPLPSLSKAVLEHPSETGPPTEIIDNKIIASVIGHQVHPLVRQQACQIQRMFVQGRQLLQSAVDLDYHNRMQALSFYDACPTSRDGGLLTGSLTADMVWVSKLPLLSLCDYVTAFPLWHTTHHSECLERPWWFIECYDYRIP